MDFAGADLVGAYYARDWCGWIEVALAMGEPYSCVSASCTCDEVAALAGCGCPEYAETEFRVTYVI